MLEGLATWVLNTYLGQYLENLNTDQLSIGLLKGEVELENVPLRKDALRHLDMSLEVRAGFVGKVRLQIPVSRLRSEPWIIVFEQLYLVAGPIDLNDYDEEAEENANLNRKISQLDSIEVSWRSEQESLTSSSGYGTSYLSWLSYGTSFITNIIENIQLKIQDVHIRYEDDHSKPGESFACGLTIESLTVQSSDQHWVPKFIYANDKSVSYRLVELKNFGLYWDAHTDVYSHKSLGELAALMVSSINGGDHEYILEPVSASACLKRNMNASPLRSRTTPRFTCDLKLEKFPLALTDLQYNQIISSIRYYGRLETARPYRKWRPKTKRVKGNAKAWWQYAIQCHVDAIHSKYMGRNWDFAYSRAKDIREYVRIYSESLRNPIKVSIEMQNHKLKIEQELSFEELRVLRELCMEIVAKELAKQKEEPESQQPFSQDHVASPGGVGEGLLQSWFPEWGGWYCNSAEGEKLSGGSTPEIERPKEEPKVSQLEEEILYVLSDSVENNTFMKRDAVFAQLSFSLKKGNIILSSVEENHEETEEDFPESKSNIVQLFELEFSSVKMAFESRPRNQSYSFDIELGTMSLKDQITEDTSYPLLISQQRDSLNQFKGGRGVAPSYLSRLSNMISSVRLGSGAPSSLQPPLQSAAQGPLFSLSYEKKPNRTNKTDHRLIITSQALDIVYNQRAFGAISDYFFPHSLKEDEDQILRTWTESARLKYEELKEQTKEEIKKNWSTMIQGIMTMERKRWDIELDISAPQIIIPENFEDQNATIVILDFGKLVFCTSQQKTGIEEDLMDKTSNSDEEDSFATPCSTPEEFNVKEEKEKLYPDEEQLLSASDFHEHLYDKFDLKLSDMQVLVAKVKDNWRFAYQKGTGPMHVIDRFNINLHLERRILEVLPDNSSSGDYLWPHLKLSGGLPKLVIHVNEQKVMAIRNLFSMHMWTNKNHSDVTGKTQSEETTRDFGARTIPRSETLTSVINRESFDDSYKDSQSDSKLIVMQFNVETLSIELQSRGRSVAELRVTGVRAQASKRPTDISASLSVHSLLLIDALQTFGSDFELLVASHKHISMDSVSGSLLDSEPCSPTSPASPDASFPGKSTSPSALSQAINSLASNRAHSPLGERNFMRSPTGVVSPTLGQPLSSIDGSKDSEALIKIELTYIAGLPPTQEEVTGSTYIFSSVQFNALDIIANQETVVELVGFIHQLFSPQSKTTFRGDSLHQPPPPQPSHPLPAADFKDNTSSTPADISSKSFYGSLAGLYSPDAAPYASVSSQRAEISFDFQKLTILLLRGTLKEKEMVGKKVGTAVLSHAKIEASIVNDILTCEGSLGGFQIRDVTPEGSKHQCIVSIGHDPIVERSQDLVSRIHSGVYQSYVDPRQNFKQRAFSFKVVRPLVLLSSSEKASREPASREEMLDSDQERAQSTNKICVQLHLASVCYTHSPQFLVELKSCAKEFKQYMAQLAFSIKQAATEMAIGLVSKRIESFSTLSGSGISVRDFSPRHLSHLRHQNFSKSTDTLVFPQPPPVSTLDSTSLSPTHGVAPDLPFNAELNIVLETPIVVLPESPNSSDVLVAHLGQISIRNKDPLLNDGIETMEFFPVKTAVFEICVKDMSLFCLNIDERLRSRDIIFHPLSTTMMNAEELYSCMEHGTPILHSTSLELTLKQTRDSGVMTEYEAGLIFPSDIYVDANTVTSSDSFTLEGGFITSLKVIISRNQYLLMCETINNLSLNSIRRTEADVDARSKKKKISVAEETRFHPERKASLEHVPIKGLFTIPALCVELRGDVGQTEQPLVNLVLEEISAIYDATEPFKSNTQITLRSLVMEDLQLNDTHSGQQFLMKSENAEMNPPSAGSGLSRGGSAPLDIPKGGLTSCYSDSFYLSTSCPEVWPKAHPLVPSSSLPSKLEMENPFHKGLKKKPVNIYKRSSVGAFTNQDSFSRSCTHQSGECPCTPPPSPSCVEYTSTIRALNKDGALVNFNIFNVDSKSSDFMSKYDGNSRFVEVDLNSLVTVINLESWVMVFDFFRSPSGAKEKDSQASEAIDEAVDIGERPSEEINMVVEVSVRSLTLVLNTSEGEMAKFAVNQVSVTSVGSAGDLTLNGRLGSLSLIDCTPHGTHYREKFLTVGKEAMTFQLFRYSEDDPDLLRNCDIRLKLKMSSIMYVHSHRFLQELTQFFLQFLFLRDKLSDWRAVRAGLKVSEKPHGTRVSLDISAGSPVIFIPMWNQSDEVLAVDLGSLSVSNKFLWSGSPETISKMRREDLFDRLASSQDGFRSRSGSLRSRSRSGNKRFCEGSRTSLSEEGFQRRGQKCLLDVMQVSLVNMDLFRSQRIPSRRTRSSKRSTKDMKTESEENVWEFGSFAVIRKGSSVLRDHLALKLQVERNLDGDRSRIVPDFSIHGILSKIHATVDVTCYKLIRGILAHNLGEPVSEMKLHPMFLSLQQASKPQRKPMFASSHIWTTLSIHFDLDDVIVEAELSDQEEEEMDLSGGYTPRSESADSWRRTPFSRIHFIKSKLLFESSSDSTKDVDLVSQEILISDTRFDNYPANKRSNVFSHILVPAQDKNLKNENPLQAEIHYRSTSDMTQFTVLLNNMRLMAILDWWKIAQYFIQSSPPNPPGRENVSAVQSTTKARLDCRNLAEGSLQSRANPLRLNPMVESTGLMTKHLLISEEYQVPFELKLNITDSEVVIVENSREWDSPAVILKTTAVVSYRPQFQERPISCNLNQCELYSCTLGFEEETALSIIDPVTINIEVNDHAIKKASVDIANIALHRQHAVEVSLHQLNIRLSYHDMKMFQRILESFPRQNMEISRKSSRTQRSSYGDVSHEEPANFTAQVEKLQVLGFSQEDCLRGLKECGGRLDEAALWLTQNAQPEPVQKTREQKSVKLESAINLHGFELKTGSVNMTLIDDCGDCDVPLLELCFSHLGLKQDCEWKGSSVCTLSVDYYNRALSGWEPFIEPWKCRMEWQRIIHRDSPGHKFQVSLASDGRVNLTLTNTLLDLCRLVKENWTDDYYNRERIEPEIEVKRLLRKEGMASPLRGQRRRTPFVPFALQNDTGCDLSFYPLTEPNRSLETSESVLGEVSEENWRKVPSGETVSFAFEEKAGKQRHGHSHITKCHRLIVQVGNWNPVGPVTVDKVGVFFRLGLYQASVKSADMPSVRIVFDIKMDGWARKLIRVRSALLLTNRLPHTVELKLENISFRLGDVKTLQVESGTSAPIPLLYVWSRIHVKPVNALHSKGKESSLRGKNRSWIFCREPLHWRTLLSPNQEVCSSRVCDSVQSKESPYRFYVHVRRDNYPVEAVTPYPRSPLDMSYQRAQDWIQPGHSITLVSPMTISNLLPFDLHYEIKATDDQGRIKSGQDAFILSVDPEEEVDISFWTDSLQSSSGMNIRSGNYPYVTSAKLTDSSRRPVHLQVKVHLKYGKAIKLSVSAFFWIINKTGLPIICKQEGTNVEAAGQDSEHEVARCATPLLFSFSDLEASPTLVARVGRHLHSSCIPHFCKKFPLTQGTWVRRLHVSHKDHRPDLVYEVGVDVRTGRGRFRDTYMVTLSPRFHLENRSSHELLISQKCFTSSSSLDIEGQSTWLRAIPGCWLPFHWPRLDKDPLLCVCLCDVPGSHHWSGGFLVDKTDSFHINIRDSMGESHFLRVEILMSEATYFVVFTDPHSMPAPFRIDNFSLVQIIYYQTGTREEHLRSSVKPRYCISYAWDEVTLPPHLTCVAPGGTSGTYNLNVLGEGVRLTYENFIYITFTGTFKSFLGADNEDKNPSTGSIDHSDYDTLQLVLDVSEGSRVRLARKEVGRRSQLWRMTSTGMLQHEGSSPPFDPTAKKPRSNSNILVLDIAGPAPLPSEYTPLMLRKPDDRRRLTQTWRFTEEGRLCCQHLNMCVQAKDGFLGLTSGNDVVLGPPQKVHYGTMPNGIPVEQAVSRQRLRPGSGVLAVKVVIDGPTRVLQIIDVQYKSSPQVARTDTGDLVYISDSGLTLTSSLSSYGKEKAKKVKTSVKNLAIDDFQVQVVLNEGLGVSVVESPEELLYALFSDIVFECMTSPTHRTFDCSVRDIQVDNQLMKAQCPVVMFVSPQSKGDQSRHLPSLQISCHQLKSPNLNAYIFKHLMVTIKNLTLTIEEVLLCKFLMLLGHDRTQVSLEKVEENEYETQRMLAAATSANATRYYFTHLKLVLNQVRLSVLTSKSLTPELKAYRRKLGLTLVQFENALVNLDPFVRIHPFETSTFLFDSIKAHYESELKSQAMRILGSTDFLGNPFGLLADVSEGVQELVRDGSVGGLVMNVTHGMANSTAKVTGTLSNAVGRVTMDTKHEETRQRLLAKHFGPSPDHFVAGLMGFGLGLYGGLTSIVAQTYSGAAKEGIPGFFSGFAKGMVGTVTKPAIGFLDLAAGTASAVRETSKNPAHKLPSKTRKPRLVVGINGLMPRYSEKDAAGQELMLTFASSSSQIFLGYDFLRRGEDDLRVLFSSEQVIVFSFPDPSESQTVVLRIKFRDLCLCRPLKLIREVGSEDLYYIELTMKAEFSEASSSLNIPSVLPTKRPKVRCDSFQIASKVSDDINYAKALYEEFRHTLKNKDSDDEFESQDSY